MRSQHPWKDAPALQLALVMTAILAAACAPVGGAYSLGAQTQVICDGPPATPGTDLNAAIEAAQLGATLCLEAGTYEGSVVIEKSVTLAASGNTPGPVILDAGGEGTVVVADASGGQIALRGLTLIGGVAQDAGGGIYVTPGTELSLQRCVLSGNAGGATGGAALYASGARVRIDQSRIVGNRSAHGGSALLLDGTTEATLRASLVAENEDDRSAPIRVINGAQLSLFGATIAANRAAWALELDGTTAGTAGLRVEGSILSHDGGPLLWNTGDPAGATVGVRDTVLHGDATGVDTRRNHVGDPRLSASYRPGEGSIARGKLLALPASWSSRDLLGRTRPTNPTLGALE